MFPRTADGSLDLLALAKSAIERERWHAALRAALAPHRIGLGTAGFGRGAVEGLVWRGCIHVPQGGYCTVQASVPPGETTTSDRTRDDVVQRVVAWVEAGAVTTGIVTSLP